MQNKPYFGGNSGYYGASSKMNGHQFSCPEWASQDPMVMTVVKIKTQVMQMPMTSGSGFSFLDGTSRRFGPSRGFYKSRYFGPISLY